MCHHKAPHDFWEYAQRHEHMFDDKTIPEPESLFEDRCHRSPATRDFGSSVTPRSRIRSLYDDFCKKDYVTGPLQGTEHMTYEEKGKAAYQKYLKDYLRTVAAIDDSVGKLLDVLEAEGILEDTVVIYTSDQGMFLGEHDYQDKRWSFEESLRTPLLIRYPREIPAHTNCTELMANIDIAPTLLDYAEISIPENMQGISCRNMIAGKPQEEYHKGIYFKNIGCIWHISMITRHIMGCEPKIINLLFIMDWLWMQKERLINLRNQVGSYMIYKKIPANLKMCMKILLIMK